MLRPGSLVLAGSFVVIALSACSTLLPSAKVGEKPGGMWCRRLAEVSGEGKKREDAVKKLGQAGAKAGADYVELKSAKEGEKGTWTASGYAYDCGGEPPTR